MTVRRLVLGDRMDGSGLALTMPAADAVTQTIVIYGGKGMGKTNLAAVLAEELAGNQQRFALIDPVGVSWGLRHSADGRSEGIKLVILGGRHGDLPIEPTGGAVIADFVCDESANVVIDVNARADGTRWSMGERIKFVADYLARLLERHQRSMPPLMQIIDEAARFAPQTIPHGAVEMARCLGALEALVEEGRNSGIGITLITQRSARMAKSVSELSEVMIAFRTIGPNSVEAVADWLGEHVDKARWKEMIGQIRELPRGQALVVSPGWLKFEGVVAFKLRQTFDSSKTPTGTEQRLAKRVQAPNLEAYRDRMAETIAAAEAADPRKLRAKLAGLQSELEGKRVDLEAAHKQIAEASLLLANLRGQVKAKQAKAVPAFTEADRTALAKLVDTIGLMPATLNRKVSEAADALRNDLDTYGNRLEHEVRALLERPGLARILEKLDAVTTLSAATVAKAREDLAATPGAVLRGPVHVHIPPPGPGPATRQAIEQTARHVNSHQEAAGDRRLYNEKGMRRHVRAILTVLAQYNSRPRVRDVVLMLAGLKPSGDTATAFSGLVEAGYVREQSDGLALTPLGLQVLGSYEPLPTGRALRDFLLRRLSSAERKILEALFAHYPNQVPRAAILEEAKLRPSGDTAVAFAKFVRLGWAEESNGAIAASRTFYEGEA